MWMVQEGRLEQVLKDIDAKKEDMITLAKKLISYETPAPPARNTADAQAFVQDYLNDCAFTTEKWDVYPNDPNVVGTKKGHDSSHFQSLIINGHMDVAEVRPDENWETDPFDPIVKENRLMGRGAADMKGGLAASLFVLRLFHEQGIELSGDVIFQSVIGEEVGEAGTLQCCRRGYTADFALVVDTSHLHIQGQGGVVTGWITIKDPQTYHDANRRQMIHAGGRHAPGGKRHREDDGDDREPADPGAPLGSFEALSRLSAGNEHHQSRGHRRGKTCGFYCR
ncbi:N-formyl-4-amino-5-aminomethyl-2-methylpyrimidine deformylase [Salisediminibacterium beveridgei]|uniref:N-formyl-4-amino-5-aminomethyl-2-methylpyrimidine deformylase n=1 Tax=Salisediminibacterium beveridgei TaxID=632773 RepID=A0A1D7QX84_9BACI|nr:N-formyl-4-amino-5-aminomethyl-2-methylpyrimidine deformylase [Salisediminibacterium beveridgei]